LSLKLPRSLQGQAQPTNPKYQSHPDESAGLRTTNERAWQATTHQPQGMKTMRPGETPTLLTKPTAMIARCWPFRKRLSQAAKRNKPPSGKLGEIIRCLEASEAASLHDLTTLTGWKQATVRGALSRLRTRGYPIQRKTRDGTALYHLERR
jgi:biotin operon repressor